MLVVRLVDIFSVPDKEALSKMVRSEVTTANRYISHNSIFRLIAIGLVIQITLTLKTGVH